MCGSWQRSGSRTSDRCEILTVFQHPNVILLDVLHKVTACVQLSQCQFVVVLVVQNVHEVGVERMDFVEAREVFQNGSELLVDGLLGELHFAHVE